MENSILINETEIQEQFRILTEPINDGERELKKYLRAQGVKVYDVSDNPRYWKKDIDILVGNNYETSIEIKWDNRIAETGNLFIELCSDLQKLKKGWFNFCEADYLAYGDSINKVFYIIDFKELKDFIAENKERFEERTAPDYSKNGIYKWSSGLLVPLNELKNFTQKIDVSQYS